MTMGCRERDRGPGVSASWVQNLWWEAWYVGKGSVFFMEEGKDGVENKGKDNV